MSTYEAIASVTSVGALLAVVLSLALTRKQLRSMALQTEQLQQTLAVTAGASLDGLFGIATQTFIEHPALRPVFNEDEAVGPLTPLTVEDRCRASALAENLADVIDRSIAYDDQRLPGLETSLIPWTRHSIENSTYFRRWLLEHREWYSDRLIELAVEVEERLSVPPSDRDLPEEPT